jgi:hypothetical protein
MMEMAKKIHRVDSPVLKERGYRRTEMLRKSTPCGSHDDIPLVDIWKFQSNVKRREEKTHATRSAMRNVTICQIWRG